VKLLQVDPWRRLGLTLAAEHPGNPVQKLALPLLDLADMHVEQLRQFVQRFLAPGAVSATFALKTGVWFRLTRLAMVSPVLGRMPRSGENPPIGAVQFSRAILIPLITSRLSTRALSRVSVGKCGKSAQTWLRSARIAPIHPYPFRKS